MFKNKNKGFTLIELLVVIGIIGILSSVVLASLNNARQKARDAKRVSDLKQLQLALELYFDSNGTYIVAASGTDVTEANLGALTPTYIPTIPAGPTAGETYQYGAAALYYCLGANVEGTVPGNHAACDDGEATSDYEVRN